MFADLDAGDVGGDRVELAADFLGSAGLEIDHVLGGGAAEQVEQDDALGLARKPLAFLRFFRLKQSGQSEAASEQAQGAGRECLAARQAVTGPPWTAQHGNHGLSPSWNPAGRSWAGQK